MIIQWLGLWVINWIRMIRLCWRLLILERTRWEFKLIINLKFRLIIGGSCCSFGLPICGSYGRKICILSVRLGLIGARRRNIWQPKIIMVEITGTILWMWIIIVRIAIITIMLITNSWVKHKVSNNASI